MKHEDYETVPNKALHPGKFALFFVGQVTKLGMEEAARRYNVPLTKKKWPDRTCVGGKEIHMIYELTRDIYNPQKPFEQLNQLQQEANQSLALKELKDKNEALKEELEDQLDELDEQAETIAELRETVKKQAAEIAKQAAEAEKQASLIDKQTKIIEKHSA